eukprot:TRINITY_DN6944_c0_g1_i2.p1 TRINITY_DN6944_c0_g1~~TRINITY_DN6944_c0_g1_i2.p1  ORF type:complete len:206 (+),score=16.68 TRINITY_DN6944_c0_g1_i2:125-742(+)
MKGVVKTKPGIWDPSASVTVGRPDWGKGASTKISRDNFAILSKTSNTGEPEFWLEIRGREENPVRINGELTFSKEPRKLRSGDNIEAFKSRDGSEAFWFILEILTEEVSDPILTHETPKFKDPGLKSILKQPQPKAVETQPKRDFVIKKEPSSKSSARRRQFLEEEGATPKELLPDLQEHVLAFAKRLQEKWDHRDEISETKPKV